MVKATFKNWHEPPCCITQSNNQHDLLYTKSNLSLLITHSDRRTVLSRDKTTSPQKPQLIQAYAIPPRPYKQHLITA